MQCLKPFVSHISTTSQAKSGEGGEGSQCEHCFISNVSIGHAAQTTYILLMRPYIVVLRLHVLVHFLIVKEVSPDSACNPLSVTWLQSNKVRLVRAVRRANADIPSFDNRLQP